MTSSSEPIELQGTGYCGVPPHSVVPLRHLTPSAIKAAAHARRDTWVHVALGACSGKSDVMAAIAAAFHFPATFGGNFDALYDALTDIAFEKTGAGEPAARGYAIFLEALPVAGDFDREIREALLDVFRDAAEFHSASTHPFRVFYTLSD